MAELTLNTTGKKNNAPSLLGEIVKSKEFIVTASSLVTAIIFFYKLLEKPVQDINTYTLLIEVSNIVVLIVALIIFNRKYSFTLPKKQCDVDILIKQEVSHPGDPGSADAVIITNRLKTRVKQVSKLVYQLLNTFKGFTVCLILLYAFLFITDFNRKRETDKRLAFIADLETNKKIADSTYRAEKLFMLKTDSVKNGATLHDTAKARRDTVAARLKVQSDSVNNINDAFIEKIYRDHTSLVGLIMAKEPSNEIVVNEIIVAIVDNFFNVLSAAFLLMAFYVLFHQKVDENKEDADDAQSSNNYWTPVLIAVVIILLSTLIIFTGFCRQNLQSLIIWMRITGGIFNGVCMLLLVSRFISMEYLYKQSDDIAKNFYLVGTIVILPVYVVVQPLWGIFQVNIENKEILKEIILMLCLWGKIFFIMIIYYMLNNRWLHTYIYMMPVAGERMKLVTETFDDTVANITLKKKENEPPVINVVVA